MKIVTITLFLFFSIGISSLVNANEEDRNVFKSYLSTFEKALNNNDIEQILPLMKEDVVVVFVNAEVVTGTAEVKKYHEKILGNSNALLKAYSTKASVSAPARFIGNTAVAHGTALDTYTLANGDVIEMETIWNVALTKDVISNEWKIVQLHFSANPFNNPVMKAINDKIVFVGLFCAIIGLLLGLVIGRFRKKV